MNVYKGLLFLHGHFVRAEDVVEPDPNIAPAAACATADPQTIVTADVASATKPTAIRSCFDWLETLLFLGGRPMHGAQLSDLQEPFEQTVRTTDKTCA
jgi:hypothetical protein